MLLQGAATLPLAAAADGHAQGVKSQDISAGRVSGVFVAPARVPAPAIFVLHTAWGRVHSADIAYAKALAGAGFVAFAINYPGKGKPTWVPEYLGWMVRRPEVEGQPLGAVGFSMGGRCAFYFGVDPRVRAVVSYYGTYDLRTTPIPSMHADNPRASPIGLVDELHCAALLLHGERDTEVPLEQIERMKQAMHAHGLPCESVIYPGAYHCFDRGSPTASDRTAEGTLMKYDSAAAKDSAARSIAWFRKYLV
ncbi:MAG TPA: dienelactone hydrolase family protein [Reyranella sp.]|nr:dienelactone hydrolase family protein [Reyranella sp.]